MVLKLDDETAAIVAVKRQSNGFLIKWQCCSALNKRFFILTKSVNPPEEWTADLNLLMSRTFGFTTHDRKL